MGNRQPISIATGNGFGNCGVAGGVFWSRNDDAVVAAFSCDMNSLMILAAAQATKPPNLWAFGVAAAAGLLIIVLVVLFRARRYFETARSGPKEEEPQASRTQNPSAFMAASMQGAIQKLRDHEKELQRLHRIEKERAAPTAPPSNNRYSSRKSWPRWVSSPPA